MPAELDESPLPVLPQGKAVMASTRVQPITDAERGRREQALDAVDHTSAMEGLTPSAESLADGQAYVAGEIDLEEFGRRTQARYGVG